MSDRPELTETIELFRQTIARQERREVKGSNGQTYRLTQSHDAQGNPTTKAGAFIVTSTLAYRILAELERARQNENTA